LGIFCGGGCHTLVEDFVADLAHGLVAEQLEVRQPRRKRLIGRPRLGIARREVLDRLDVRERELDGERTIAVRDDALAVGDVDAREVVARGRALGHRERPEREPRLLLGRELAIALEHVGPSFGGDCDTLRHARS
jgi:hypothetical protein